jgi:hypothetical protein
MTLPRNNKVEELQKQNQELQKKLEILAENFAEFCNLVALMRCAQTKYFSTRAKKYLAEAKQFETKVDMLLLLSGTAK